MTRESKCATVSVLLPTFNRAAFIGAAIESILRQSHRPHEVIVLDDGSTDETRAVCAAYAPEVTYLRADHNQGKSAAINRGLIQATGEFIWAMDDDDIAPPHALETLLAPLRQRPDAGFSFGQLLKFTEDADGRRAFEPLATPASDTRPLFVRLMEDCFITGQPCTLIRRACFDAIGPVDETVLASVDYNILLRVARRFEGCDVGKVVLWQRQHSGLRGPQQLRYRESQRNKRWQLFDNRLLGDLLPNLALEELIRGPAAGRDLTTSERRRAYFQKAVIAARKDLWDIVFASLARARAVSLDPLDAQDRSILSRMLGSRYGIDVFLGVAQIQRRLCDAAGDDETGVEIRAAVAALLPYHIGQALKDRDPKRAILSAAALCRVLGTLAALQLALDKLSQKLEAHGLLRALAPQRRHSHAGGPFDRN